MTIQDALEHRHTCRVQWETPWPGKTIDGEETCCNVLQSATVHDVINYQRYYLTEEMKHNVKITDEYLNNDTELLTDFIIVHWAQVIEK